MQLYDLLFVVRDIGLLSPEPGNTSSASESTSATEAHQHCQNRKSLSLAERTLNDFDVLALARRLLMLISALQTMVIGVERPGECGGGLRLAYVNRPNDRYPLRKHTRYRLDNYTEMPAPHSQWREKLTTMIKTWNWY